MCISFMKNVSPAEVPFKIHYIPNGPQKTREFYIIVQSVFLYGILRQQKIPPEQSGGILIMR